MPPGRRSAEALVHRDLAPSSRGPGHSDHDVASQHHEQSEPSPGDMSKHVAHNTRGAPRGGEGGERGRGGRRWGEGRGEDEGERGSQSSGIASSGSNKVCQLVLGVLCHTSGRTWYDSAQHRDAYHLHPAWHLKIWTVWTPAQSATQHSLRTQLGQHLWLATASSASLASRVAPRQKKNRAAGISRRKAKEQSPLHQGHQTRARLMAVLMAVL